MAAFNLTAELNLRGPSNLNQVVGNIRRQLSTLTLDLNINPTTSRGIQAVTGDVRTLSAALRDAQTNAVALGAALRGLGASVSNLAASTGNLNTNLTGISRNATSTGTAIRAASSEMSEFGRQSALAIRRFAAFSVATGAVYALSRAVTSAYGEFMNFNKEFVRLQQVTDSTAGGLASLSSEITRLATSLGVGSQELVQVSVTLAQAGLSAGETKTALEALAKSALAPSFDSLNDTVEGSIALMRQFGIGASDLESSLGSVNAVAAKFAVEAGDIITAIQRTGGVFANASKGVSTGKDALNEFLAVFTSVRATTRESAETIATGLRTIFTRIQRGGTIDALKQYGIELTDLEGKFVGPYEAVRRLSEGLKTLDPRDLRFSQIVEELGGFRQIGKVIPLIQQFETAQKALGVAQRGAGSLAADAATAQEALSVKINKVREQFIALIRDIGQSQGFQTFVDISLKLASALISVADAAKDVLPAIAAITAIRGVGALGQFFSGFSGGLGRRPRGFAKGGRVPGSGSGDTVPAMLTPGEFVIRKKAVDAIGAGNLHRMNKYANGGRVKRFARGGIANAPMIDDILQTSGSVLPKPSAVEALIKAGGGAVDIDRTLKRTIGDKAYSKAPSSGSQKNVLERFFADEAARLNDIKSAPLTAFGKSLQDAIRSGQLKGSRVSIISKSRRTKGVPEYLSQLFGIPVQNMVFTQGGTKQPAMDAIRSKGPRIERVGRFASGGLVQRFAGGGFIDYLRSQNDVGAAILEQGGLKQQPFTISKKQLEAAVGAKLDPTKLPPLKLEGKLEGLRGGEGGSADIFDKALEKGILQGVNTAAGEVAKGLGLGYVDIPQDKSKSFISGINVAAKGNLFEDVLLALKESPGPFTERKAGQPFDFPTGLPSVLKDDYKNLPNAWVDAKASFGTAERAGRGLPDKALKQLRNEIKPQLDFYKAVEEKQQKTTQAVLSKFVPGKTYSLQELGMNATEAKNAGFVSPYRGKWQIPVGKATGGPISGEDTVPALLTPGEFVINKKAAKRIGASRLNQLNKADKVQGFNSGGFVQKFALGGPAARPTNPSGFSVIVPDTTIVALQDMAEALEALGVSASQSATLVEKGGAINIRESERAYQADVARMRMAGASATDIYNAEQNLARIREQNALKIDTAREMSGFGGERLQNIQTRAEAEQQRITQALVARGATEEQLTANRQRIRSRAFENVTAAEMGTSRRGLAARGMTGGTIEQYISQSMMDTRTLRQMNQQLMQTREQEIQARVRIAAAAGASAEEQRRMTRDLRARAREEIAERTRIATQLRADRGLGGGTFQRIRNTLGTAGSLVGMGEMREDAFGTGRRGTSFARGWNRLSQGTQTMGLGLTFAGGMLGDLVGKARGGKEGEALSAGVSAFVGSAGIGMMFGPIGALTGVIVGATTALQAYTQSLIEATIAEESQKIEGSTIRLQRSFEKLDKSTKKTDIQSGVREAAQELGQVASIESRKQNSITDKAISERTMAERFEGVGPNMFRIEKELVASARQTNVLQSLPQIFEQGMTKGLTVQQIQASFPPGELDKLKEVFATASGDTVIAGLVARREEMQSRPDAKPEDIAVIDDTIKRMSGALFNKDILKPLMDRKAAEDAMATAAAAATVKVNLLAEVLKGVNAAASKAGASFEETQRQIAITAGSAFGETFKVQGPSRQQENILDNIQAYSVGEIRNVIGEIGQQFQFNPALTREAQGAAVNQRILGEELPKILADIAAREGQGFDPEGAPANVIRKQLDEVFKTAIPDAGTRGETVQRLVDKIGERLRSRQGITVEELAGDERALADIMKMDADTLKVFNDLLKQSNNVIAELNNSMNNWATQMSQAIQSRIEAQNIGIDADNQLARALGEGLNLSDMNAVFENTIMGLTERIGAGETPIAGTGTMDPATIMQRMLDKEQESRDIQKQLDTEKPPIDSARYKALDEALRRSTLEARNLASAHQKLQSDSSRAANALTKIGELRQVQESRQGAFLDLLKNVNNPEAMMEFTNEVQSFFAQMSGQGTTVNLEAAIKGLERQMSVLAPEDAAKLRADFIQSAGDTLRAEGIDPALIDALMENTSNVTPEMQALIGEFYKYTDVQQNAVEQAAQRTISAANIAHDQLVQGATTARNIISAAGQQNPVNVVPVQAKSRGGTIYASNGQFVNFQPKGTDTVPAMLTPGEFVVNAKATKKNRALLHAINGGKVGGYSSGGMVYLNQGGYVPKDTTIEADAAVLQAEIDAIKARIDEQLAAVNATLQPLIEQQQAIPQGPQNDPQRRQLWEQLSPLYQQRDALTAQRNSVDVAYQPKLSEIQQRRNLEAERKMAATGELPVMTDLGLAQVPGSNLGLKYGEFKDGSFSVNEEKMTPEERKLYAEYKAEREKRKQARLEVARQRVAEADAKEAKAAPRLPADQARQQAAVQQQTQRAKPNREAINKQRQAAVAEEKARRRQAFLEANPFYRKKAEKEASRQQKELEEAQAWFATTQNARFVYGNDDILKDYRQHKADQRSQANRERLLFGSPVKTDDPDAKAKREQAQALTKEQLAEQARIRRGEELAKRFGWKLSDTTVRNGTVVGSYRDYEAGEEPYDLRTLSREDRQALDDYQMQKLSVQQKAESDKKMAEYKATKEAEWSATKAQIAAKVEEERQKKEAAQKQFDEEYSKKEQARKTIDQIKSFGSNIVSGATAAYTTYQTADKDEEGRIIDPKVARQREREQRQQQAVEQAQRLREAQIQAVADNVVIDPITGKMQNADLPTINEEIARLEASKAQELSRLKEFYAKNPSDTMTPESHYERFSEIEPQLQKFKLIAEGLNKAKQDQQMAKQAEIDATEEEYQKFLTAEKKGKLRGGDVERYARLAMLRGRKWSDIPGGSGSIVNAERGLRDDYMGEENRKKQEKKEFVQFQEDLKKNRDAMAMAQLEFYSELISTPGKLVRTALATGSVTETAKALIPGQGTSGRELLRSYGAVGNENTYGNFAGGMLAEVLTDPFAAGKILKGGITAAKAAPGAIRTAGAATAATARGAAKGVTQGVARARAQAAKLLDQPAAPSRAQADWLKKNMPIEGRSPQQLSEAVARGEEMAARFEQMGIETPNFGTTGAGSTTATKVGGSVTRSTTGATRMSKQTKSLMEKSGTTEEVAEAYAARAAEKQAAEKAAQEARDAATRAKAGTATKATGSKRYDITEDMGPITTADRKGAVKAIEQAQKASDKAAKKTSGKKTITFEDIKNKPVNELTAEEQVIAMSQAMGRNKPGFFSASLPTGRGVLKAGTTVSTIVGAGLGYQMGYLDPMNLIESMDPEIARLIKKYSYKSKGGMIYASKGTLVPYQPRGTDTVPAMLTPGEFVINRKAAKQNMGLLKAINNGHNVQPKLFNRGGIVPTQYYADGVAGVSGSSSSSGGVSSISVDSSSLDAAFSNFSSYVSSLSSVIDNFTQGTTELAGLSQAIGALGNLGLRDGASLMANAGTSVKEATSAFSTALTAFNTSSEALATAISAIPSTISLTVSGSIPVTVSVQIEGGTGGNIDTTQLEQSIMDRVGLAINSATQGGINIDTSIQ